MAKNLILWMIIAGILLTVFQNINQETREDNINYSEFVREVRSGRVVAVELAGINITGNAIIPLKERVVDRYYDPVKRIWRALSGKKARM